MVKTLADVRPGETVLVMGAGSGVGSMGVQIAKFLGAQVLSTVGAEDKIEKAKTLGSAVVINHATEDVAKRVQTMTGGRGVDVVIEHIGQVVVGPMPALVGSGWAVGHVRRDVRTRDSLERTRRLYSPINDQRILHGHPR